MPHRDRACPCVADRRAATRIRTALYHKMTVAPPVHDRAAIRVGRVPGATSARPGRVGDQRPREAPRSSPPPTGWWGPCRWAELAAPTSAGSTRRRRAPWLSPAFVNENFRFNQVLTGQKVLQPRWKRLPQRDRRPARRKRLGQVFVARAFPRRRRRPKALAAGPETWKRCSRQDLTTLPWMSDDTRRQAIAKARRVP